MAVASSVASTLRLESGECLALDIVQSHIIQTVKVEQGTSQVISASITDQAAGPVHLNVSTNGHDGPFGLPPLLYGFAVPSGIGPTASAVTATFRVSAAWTANVGERYVTLTAYNNN